VSTLHQTPDANRQSVSEIKIRAKFNSIEISILRLATQYIKLNVMRLPGSKHSVESSRNRLLPRIQAVEPDSFDFVVFVQLINQLLNLGCKVSSTIIKTISGS
jgi:hypothetical protein